MGPPWLIDQDPPPVCRTRQLGYFGVDWTQQWPTWYAVLFVCLIRAPSVGGIFSMFRNPWPKRICLASFTFNIQWRPGIGWPHKADHPGMRTTFSQSQFFPHSHNVLAVSESGPTRDWDTDHPFSVTNYKRTQETDHLKEQKNDSHFYSLMGETYVSSKGPAAARFTNGTSCSWIQWWDKLGLHPLIGPAEDPLRYQHNSLSVVHT